MVAHPITRPLLWAAAVAALGVVAPVWALPLTYKGDNKWVAPEDNKPLRGLMAKAKGGQTHFTVALPAANRELSAQRLAILLTILEREAGQAVVIEETPATAKANTLDIR